MVIGVTKAGKTTLLNKLIGLPVLISNEERATATRWSVKFHKSDSIKLDTFKTVNK